MTFLKALPAKLCFASLLFLSTFISNPVKAQTTLVAGDIAFTGYISSHASTDAFSFVILTNITSGTVINFTDNGWLSTNVFRSGEQTVTWTSSTALSAGTEIMIAGPANGAATATLVGGGVTGVCTGNMPSLSINGDQVLAYQGSVATPTFISAIHMNVYTILIGDPVSTTAAAWDGTANTTNGSALPSGLTNGVNAIWVGTQDVTTSEKDNGKFNCTGPLSTAAQVRAAVNNMANWTTEDGGPTLIIPTGCSYIAALPAPSFTTQPSNSTICDGTGTSFTIAATGATSYQWQVDQGGGFTNLNNNSTYSGATSATLTIAATASAMNGYLYRCVATNGSGSTNSNSATLTVTPLPANPTLLTKTPATINVADGTPVSATFTAGSGGTGCADDYRYTTDGGATYLPYTPGSNISTTGLAAGSGYVFIEGRRANCSSSCQNSYVVIASWNVTPLPASATTLNAGDIAFSGYHGFGASASTDEFSFVLLKNIGPNTVINFTNNGWLSTNVFRSGEETVTWTSPAALPAGTEIKIAGLTATKSGGGAAGSVSGTALGLSANGDQILAYRGTVASPTFISAIHMNVYSVANGDPTTTTAAAWDGTANTTNASALPTGLTTGVNAIWIGTQDVIGSEYDNAIYGTCSLPATYGPVNTLRSALNNQANWSRSNGDPTGFTLPTGCNYLGGLCPTITVTNPVTTTGTVGTAFSQTFTSTGGTPVVTYSTSSTLPTGLTLSSAGVLSGTPTQSGTFPIVVVATDGGGCTGTGTTYSLVIGCPTITVTNPAVASGTVGTAFSQTFTATGGNPTVTFSTSSSLPAGLTLSSAGVLSGTPTQSGTFPIVVVATDGVAASCTGSGTTYNLIISCQTITVGIPANASGTAGTAFSETFTETGSLGSATFTTVSTLPSGISLSSAGVLSGTPTQTGTFPIVVTVTDGNSCTGTSVTYTLVIGCPAYTVTATPASQSICSGASATSIVLSGGPAGTTYNWTRDNTATVTGTIPSSGSGNITGNLVNNTGSPITVTFTITSSAFGCPGAPISASVTVNPLPTASITGYGTFCQESNTILTAGFDPNYTYAWGISNFGAPFTPLGTAQTQLFTKSGNVLLTVTNQYSCQDTAMNVVNIADYVFNGSLAAGDAIQTGRLNRFAVISTCAAPKACPGTFTTTGSRLYDSYTITNVRNVPVCVTIGINSQCGTNIFCAAYSGSFNPASVCTNYLADPGSSFLASGFYEATIPANGTIVVVVHEVNTGTGCAGYRLTVDVPREAADITVTPSNPVCGVTPLTLTASAANTYSWTPGGATTQSINATPPAGTNTYSVALGYGNNGCTNNVSENVVVTPTPDVNTVNDQFFCAGSATTAITFSGSVSGTTYNWTNTNTGIGLGASGSGDILSFTATNGTAAPISGTITVTPVNGSCTGTPITFTIWVSPAATITGVTEDSVCSPGGVVNLTAAGSGGINWFNVSTGGNPVHSGTGYSPNITATTTYYVESLVPAGPVQNLAMPAQSSTFPGNVRGYWFTAPANFTITSLYVPTTASSGVQHVAVVKFNGNTPPPVFSASTNAFTTLFLSRNNATTGRIPCNIPVQAGEVIGILGNRANLNSYAPGDYATTIAGFPVQLERLGMQFPLSSTDPRDLWREFGATTSISRIEFEYSAGQVCVSTPRTPVTGTMLPTPVATATPASQTVCSGPITTIALTSTVPGTTYAWTRDNTVDVTGISASGSGDISGTLTNNTTVPQTVTFTITPTSADGCVGASITATVTVNAVPTIVCPANITVSNAAGQCGNTVTYSPTITGIPVPTVTYTFTGATTGSGSGDGSGSFFNKGTTTVTITATNSCGTANCSFTVTVNDTELPVITCPAPVTVSCAAAVPVPDITAVTATDNCPGVVVTHVGDVISSQTCANRYTITRTYRATDAANNFSECTQIITVNDQTPPVITCPAPVTVSCAAAVPAPNIASVTATDNCAGTVTIVHVGDVISNQTCANRYTITRTYRATDVCGNSSTCTQIITVNDQTPPVMTCPAPVTVSCAAAVPAANVASVTGVSDNCGGTVTVTHVGDVISSQTCANRYTITRTYRATDVCGNFTECTQIITVNDQTPPVITCPAPVTVSCAAAVPVANIASVTATDNCAGTVTIVHVGDVISNQTCANRYTITRTYRATDVCGNSSTCTQTITVNDQTAPVITCPSNITVTTPVGSCTATVNYTVTATDNCGGAVTIVSTPASGFAFPIGTTTVTSVATDACGNQSTCSFTVTVLDGQLPVIGAQPANRTVCAGTNATFSVTASNVVTYQWQQWNGTAWVNITGANSSSYTVSNVSTSMNISNYRVILNGLCTVVTSNHATLYVNPLPAITLDAAPANAILPSQSTTITATASPAGGSFVWRWNGNTISGVNGAVLGPLSIDRIGDYHVTYTDLNGCVNTSSLISIKPAASDNLWVYPNPNTGQFNVRYYNQTGEKATLRVYNAGGQVVFEQALSLGITYSNTVINLDNVAAGTFIVKIVNSQGGELAARRIIVYHP